MHFTIFTLLKIYIIKIMYYCCFWLVDMTFFCRLNLKIENLKVSSI